MPISRTTAPTTGRTASQATPNHQRRGNQGQQDAQQQDAIPDQVLSQIWPADPPGVRLPATVSAASML
jgi:hypothetical protein